LALNEQVLASPGKSKTTSSAEPSCESTGLTSRNTETSPPLTGQPSSPSICSAEGSHAKTLAKPAGAEDCKVNGAGFGLNSPEPFAHYDHASSLWKTSQACLSGSLGPFSATWPKWGSMRSGQCFHAAPLVRHMHESACFLWPTPRVHGGDNAGGSNSRKTAKLKGTYVAGQINPSLYEWLLGYQDGWTDLNR